MTQSHLRKRRCEDWDCDFDYSTVRALSHCASPRDGLWLSTALLLSSTALLYYSLLQQQLLGVSLSSSRKQFRTLNRLSKRNVAWDDAQEERRYNTPNKLIYV